MKISKIILAAVAFAAVSNGYGAESLLNRMNKNPDQDLIKALSQLPRQQAIRDAVSQYLEDLENPSGSKSVKEEIKFPRDMSVEEFKRLFKGEKVFPGFSFEEVRKTTHYIDDNYFINRELNEDGIEISQLGPGFKKEYQKYTVSKRHFAGYFNPNKNDGAYILYEFILRKN